MVYSPLRCISSCARYLGTAYATFKQLKDDGYSQDEALCMLELNGKFQFCCRSTILCHVDCIQEGVKFVKERIQIQKHTESKDKDHPMPDVYDSYRDPSEVVFCPSYNDDATRQKSIREIKSYVQSAQQLHAVD